MNLDDILGRIHHDATARLEDRLASVERELMRRRLLSAEAVTTLFDQLRELEEEILRLQPEGDHAIDLHHLPRRNLEREARTIRRDIIDELKTRWKDEQDLRREHRELIQQRQAANDRYEVNRNYRAS